jgi:hypothetical protein
MLPLTLLLYVCSKFQKVTIEGSDKFKPHTSERKNLYALRSTLFLQSKGPFPVVVRRKIVPYVVGTLSFKLHWLQDIRGKSNETHDKWDRHPVEYNCVPVQWKWVHSIQCYKFVLYYDFLCTPCV